MNEIKFFKVRLCFTTILAIAIWSLLIWKHYHGGVPSHHLLANEEFPAISNWWGAILLPLLSWFLLYRTQKRVFGNANRDVSAQHSSGVSSEFYGFAGSLLFGVLLSGFFTFGYSEIPGYMILGLFPVALLFPIYRAECLLGFVVGMTFTFGAVLPTGFGSILALISLVLYLYVRPALLFVTAKIKG